MRAQDASPGKEFIMTAARAATATTGRAVAFGHPRTTGRVVLLAGVVVNVAITWALFFTADPSKNGIIAVAKFVGLHLALAVILQLVLIARLPWLDRRIGMDRLTAWHRWVGLTIFWLVLLHPTLMIVGYARYENLTVPEQFLSFAGVFATLMGMLAAGTIIVVIILSTRAARRRLSYEAWHAVHMFLYVAVTLALIHQALEPSFFRESLITLVYWTLLWGLAIAALIVGRIVTPLRLNARHRLRVAKVVPESDNVASVYVSGRDLDRLQARPGQFFIWRFLGYNSWWQANPFSISAAPDGQHLRLTPKAVGTTSAGLRHVPVGTRVFVEGPYGAFTSRQRSRDSTLLIAGGIGITPIRALLEELTGPVTVLYRVHGMADAVLLQELEELARGQSARVQVLTGRTGAGNPPNTPFEPDNLAALVPDIRERDVFVCGPPAMMSAVIRSLRTLGVPRHQIHAERFSLAASR
jgi:predicted ferric reductase